MLTWRAPSVCILAISVLIECDGTASRAAQLRILGGYPVKIESSPYSAQFFNVDISCGSCILGSKVLLTAAHCLDSHRDVGLMYVLVGSTYYQPQDEESREQGSGSTHDVWDFALHEHFDADTYQCDIALLFLADTLVFGLTTQKAVLVDSEVWMHENATDFEVKGWGLTQDPSRDKNAQASEVLMATHLNYVTREHCSELLSSNITEDMFCLYGDHERDSCLGDSGGGILWHGLLVGIVSHSRGAGCAVENEPGVYTNVFYFREWIRGHWLALREKYCPHEAPEI